MFGTLKPGNYKREVYSTTGSRIYGYDVKAGMPLWLGCTGRIDRSLIIRIKWLLSTCLKTSSKNHHTRISVKSVRTLPMGRKKSKVSKAFEIHKSLRCAPLQSSPNQLKPLCGKPFFVAGRNK